MKADLKETFRNEYVHGYINGLGQRVMPTLEDLKNEKVKTLIQIQFDNPYFAFEYPLCVHKKFY